MSDNKASEIQSQSEEKEVDLLELAQKVWNERRLILKWCLVAVVIGLIIGFSIPKEYSTRVTLAPESATSNSLGGNMGALAAMAGVNLGNSTGEDALSPELYPNIVSSSPFLIELLDIKVIDKKGEIETTVYNYLEQHQKKPWWSAIISAPFKALGWVMSLFRDEPEITEKEAINPFMLTQDEAEIIKELDDRISVSVDKKSGVTTLSVTMQDPLISATMTDTVMNKLQSYITNYRTNKARHDLVFTEKLYEEAKKNYFKAQYEHARYVDSNQNIVRESTRAEETRLQNEMDLAYNLYNQVAQQLQMALAKVQEITPVYTVVQPATVPLRPEKPNKVMILIGCVFLAAIAAIGWILFVKGFVVNWRSKSKQKIS